MTFIFILFKKIQLFEFKSLLMALTKRSSKRSKVKKDYYIKLV